MRETSNEAIRTQMDIAEQIARTLEQLLKPEGYRRVRNSLYVKMDNVWGLINLQKSRKTNKDRAIFTINLGVVYEGLRLFQGDESYGKPPVNIALCHWERRIGSFLPGRPDKWWEHQTGDDPEPLVKEVVQLCQQVILPELHKVRDERRLCDEFLSKPAYGLSERLQLMILSLLLRKLGPADRYQEIIAKLRSLEDDSPAGQSVREHLAHLLAH